jgi:polyhydroxyalkanoate synthesis regulator phasin
MDFSSDFFGIKMALKIDQEVADNMRKAGDFIKEQCNNIYKEFVPDISRENEEWTTEEYANFENELVEGKDLVDISVIHKRSIARLTQKLEDLLNIQIDNDRIKNIKEKYNYNSEVTNILARLIRQL